MGIAVSTANTSVIQNAVNTTYQSAQNTCKAECNQTQSGTTIVLTNTTAGNITFSQKCTASASCYMDNALDAAVQTFQDAKAGSTASPSLFPGMQLNVTEASTKQDIKNEITQVMTNLCQGAVNQIQTDTIIYATDSTLKDIGFVQDGNANADCVMQNTARLTLQMKQAGSATAKAGGGISIGMIILAVIILVVIMTVVGKKGKKNEGEVPDPNAPGADSTGKGGKSRFMDKFGGKPRPTSTRQTPGKKVIPRPKGKAPLAPRKG